jgi:hypothetical protein
VLYWIGGINAGNWLYVSLVRSPPLPIGERVEVPTGFMLCADDILSPPPGRWLNRNFNMVHRRDLFRGGHFLALKHGETFVQELRHFFRPFR